jgi:hypothetical protein
LDWLKSICCADSAAAEKSALIVEAFPPLSPDGATKSDHEEERYD